MPIRAADYTRHYADTYAHDAMPHAAASFDAASHASHMRAHTAPLPCTFAPIYVYTMPFLRRMRIVSPPIYAIAIDVTLYVSRRRKSQAVPAPAPAMMASAA